MVVTILGWQHIKLYGWFLTIFFEKNFFLSLFQILTIKLVWKKNYIASNAISFLSTRIKKKKKKKIQDRKYEASWL